MTSGEAAPKKVIEQRGLWYEEFQPGVIYQHRPGRTITEADNVLFTTLTMNTQALHLDAAWSDEQMQDYINANGILVNPLVDEGYPSIGCRPCTAKPEPGSDPRSGRWQGLAKTECGLHAS